MLKPDELAQWKAGDPDATAAVNGWIRGRVDRLLRHENLLEEAGSASTAKLRDREIRGSWAAKVAADVMARDVKTVARLELMVIASASVLAVDALRDGRVWDEDEPHLDRQAAVRAALAPSRRDEAVVAHLGTCIHCARDVRLLQVVTERNSEIGALPEPAFVPSLSPPRVPSRWALLPLSVFLGLGGWALMQMENIEIRGSDVSLGDLAERHPPQLHRMSGLPPGMQAVLADLARGDCFSAGARVRSIRRSQPTVESLYVIEAQSLVCAGEPRRALDTFDDLHAAGLTMPHGGHWTEAQAHLLLDQGAEALEALGRVRISDDRRRATAIEQARLIRSRLGQDAR